MACREDGAFPVLLVRGGHGMLQRLEEGGWLELRLRRRQEGENYPLADAMVDLFADPDAVEGAFAAFLYARRVLGPCVDTWVIDVGSAPCGWPAAAHGVMGDSFSLALLFQLVARCQDANWPDGVFVTGAVRHARGFRCVAVGQAVAKGRWLALHGYRRLLLPRRNYGQLGRAGLDCDRCVALPPNLEECIALWKRCLT